MGERDNHIAIVKPSAPTKDYSRRIMGGSNGNEDSSGRIPNPDRVLEQRLLSPEIGFLVAAELRCASREYDRDSFIFRSGETL